PAARVAPPLARSARAGSLPRGPDDRSGGERSGGFEGGDGVGPWGPERPKDLPVAGVELREVLDEDQPRPLDPRLEDADDDVERLADDDDDEAGHDSDHRPAEHEAAPDRIDDEREDGAREQDPDETRVRQDVAHDLDQPHHPHLKTLAKEEHREANPEAGVPDYDERVGGDRGRPVDDREAEERDPEGEEDPAALRDHTPRVVVEVLLQVPHEETKDHHAEADEPGEEQVGRDGLVQDRSRVAEQHGQERVAEELVREEPETDRDRASGEERVGELLHP